MSEFKKHKPCFKCDSSDGRAVYGDGSSYCFVCETYFKSGYGNESVTESVVPKVKEKSALNLSYLVEDILELPIKAIPNRGISLETAKEFGVRVRHSEVSGEITHHYYPYHSEDGKVIGYKERNAIAKDFRVIGSLGKGFFGGNRVKHPKMLIILEGECLLPTTEVLTQIGWVQLKDVDDSHYVLQVDERGEGSFIKPIAKVEKDFSGKLNIHKSGVLKMTVTPEHNVVYLNKSGYLTKVKSKDVTSTQRSVPRTLSSNNTESSISITDSEIKAMVMFSADFTFRASGDLYAGFKKERKIKRCIKILSELCVSFYANKTSNGYTSVFLSRKNNLQEKFSKEFDHSLLSKLDHRQLNVLLDEIVHWDGNSVPKRNQIEYSSKLYSNATFVQTVAHLCGYTSTIMSRTNQFGSWYKVSILFGKTTSIINSYKTEVMDYSGKVMCVTVPTGMIMARENSHIFITGNCDAMAAYQMLKDQGKNYAVVSTPTGANTKAIKDNLEYLESIETVVIAFDNDKVGNEAATKALEVLSTGKGKRLKLPEPHKDANDLLMAQGNGAGKVFLEAVYNAKSFRPDGIVDMSETWDSLFSDDNTKSIPYPFIGLNDKTYGCRAREIVTITAGSGSGKSQFIRELEHHLLKVTEDNIGILALEEGTGKTGWGIISVEANLPLNIREERKNASKEQIKQWFDATLGTGRIFSFDHFGSTTEENILARVRYMIKALDCKWIFLDHLSIVVSGMDDGGDERKTIDSIMTKLRMLVEETGAGLFLVSHLKRVGDKGHENGIEVSLSHLRGSQAIAQLSDMVIALERNQQADDPIEANTTTVRVLKNRYAGLTGKACRLFYERETGRIVEVDEEEEEKGDF